MSDYSTRPTDAGYGYGAAAYEVPAPYPPPPPTGSKAGWVIGLAITSAIAIIAAAVLGTLLFDARSDLDATKATLNQTRAASGQSSEEAARMKLDLTTAQAAVTSARADTTRLQADVKRLAAAAVVSAKSASQQAQRIKDLNDCGTGYQQMYALQRADFLDYKNAAETGAFYESGDEAIQETLDKIRGSCDRANLTVASNP